MLVFMKALQKVFCQRWTKYTSFCLDQRCSSL